MPTRNRIIVVRAATTAFALSLLFLAGVPTHAQGTVYRTAASFGAINYEDRSASSSSLYGSYQQGGRVMSASGEATYSFGEGAGEALGANGDTMRLSGTAWGSSNGQGFNDLKAGVTAKLENAYLDVRDPDNAPDVNGMKAPYLWLADASAAWTMTTRFVGSSATGSGYTVKWIFGVDGVTNSYDAGYGFAYMGFNYGGYPRQSFSTESLLPQTWATDSMPVMWGDAVETSADFHANWQYNMLSRAEEVRENGVLIGYRAPSVLNATVDYASSVTIQEIQVFDQSGNRFYDFYVEDGDNNRIYSGNAVTVVPESGTAGLIGAGLSLGTVLFYRRKRQKGAR